MKNIKLNNFSIRRINLVLFFLVFLSSLTFLIFPEFFSFKIYWIGFVFSLFFLFLVLNHIYYIDFERSKNNIKQAFKNNDLPINKNGLYKENNEQYNLFKYFFIDRKIKQKDYLDLEGVLQKFTPEYFLNYFSKKGKDRIELGLSSKQFMHVMFLDIIGFTTITEKISPERALLLLNIYFDWIVEIIKKYGWNIDKFLWDWILIVFTDNNSDNALYASIEIQKYIKNFNISDIWKNISIWIGINSWEVIMWTIWSNKRMEFTIIWDVVNTASRIEGLTREFENKIIISKDTFDNILDKKRFSLKYLWERVLKWKKVKKKIYGVA